MSQCPSRSQFEKLLANELGGPDALALEQHVEGCMPCQEALASLVADAAQPRPGCTSPVDASSEEFLSRLQKHPPVDECPTPNSADLLDTRTVEPLTASKENAPKPTRRGQRRRNRAKPLFPPSSASTA